MSRAEERRIAARGLQEATNRFDAAYRELRGQLRPLYAAVSDALRLAAPRRAAAAAAAAGGGRRAVSDRFEDRLRTRAVDCRHPLGPGPRVGVPLSPDEADCTADLVAAVREVIEWKSEGGHRELDVPTQAMADRLTALDEASGRG